MGLSLLTRKHRSSPFSPVERGGGGGAARPDRYLVVGVDTDQVDRLPWEQRRDPPKQPARHVSSISTLLPALSLPSSLQNEAVAAPMRNRGAPIPGVPLVQIREPQTIEYLTGEDRQNPRPRSLSAIPPHALRKHRLQCERFSMRIRARPSFAVLVLAVSDVGDGALELHMPRPRLRGGASTRKSLQSKLGKIRSLSALERRLDA